MPLPNSGIVVTPGSGVSLAAHLLSSKYYEVWMDADAYGHVGGAHDTWVGSQTGAIFPTGDHNLCALWNGSGSGVTLEVVGYQTQQEDGTSVSFLAKNFPRMYRLTAAPSAGTTRTPVKTRSAMSALPSQVLFYGEGVTATRTGLALTIEYTNAGSDQGWGMKSRGPYRLPHWPEPLVLVEGEGIVVHGGDNGEAASVGSQALFFRVR